MSTDAPTIFGRILDGEIPCHKVYEDDNVLAFLDVNPISEGHTLVIPKERRAFLHELSADAAAAVGRVLPKIAAAVMKATGATSYNVLQNNGASAFQSVFHVHFHIIPRMQETGLGVRWEARPLETARATELATKIATSLGA